MKKRQPGREGLQESDCLWSQDESQIEIGSGYQEWDAEAESEDPPDRGRHSLVEKLIGRIGRQLESEETPTKASVTDLIRLMQVERDMKPQQCRKFVVEWIDPKPEAV
jgi:hypothetical protein